MKGTLICEEALDGQYINCNYEMKRPGNIRGLDVVYFNYNSIYGCYESIWLSSTWPIKGIAKGYLKEKSEGYVFDTSTQFKIENDITEYVKSKWEIKKSYNEEVNVFERNTHIRTSDYEEGEWHHHMTETAKRIK